MKDILSGQINNDTLKLIKELDSEIDMQARALEHITPENLKYTEAIEKYMKGIESDEWREWNLHLREESGNLATLKPIPSCNPGIPIMSFGEFKKMYMSELSALEKHLEEAMKKQRKSHEPIKDGICEKFESPGDKLHVITQELKMLKRVLERQIDRCGKDSPALSTYLALYEGVQFIASEIDKLK